MEKNAVTVPRSLFRTGLVPATVVFCLLAVAGGVLPLVSLADSEYRQYLMMELIESGITDYSSRITWSVIHYALSGLCVICPAVLAGGLTLTLRGKPAQGYGFLSTVSGWFFWFWNGLGGVLAAMYVIRAVVYVAASLRSSQAVMLIYSMVMMEGMMGVMAWFLFRCVRRFAEGFSDASASMAYTLSSGRLDSQSIPASAERGFLAMGIVCMIWAVTQVVTVTIVVTQFRSYYGIVFASHPMPYLTAASLLCNGIAGFLMFFHLRRYNRICEWEKHRARKQA